jgi:hypothetical protein
MLRILVALLLILFTTFSWGFSGNELPFISTKEQVRLSLWYQGLDLKSKNNHKSVRKYPMELERFLKKIN